MKKFDSRFTPELTPKQMLELGVFEGKYWDEIPEWIPEEWLKNAKLSEHKDPSINFFGIAASKPLEYWQNKGWIHPQDPNGWFEWYCKYTLGRRTDDDERQIKRWNAFKRHIAQIKNNCYPGDFNCRKKQRQAILHWAYDSRKI